MEKELDRLIDEPVVVGELDDLRVKLVPVGISFKLFLLRRMTWLWRLFRLFFFGCVHVCFLW